MHARQVVFRRWWPFATALALVVGLLGYGLISTASAHATTTPAPLPVSFTHTSDAAAGWVNGSIVLTVGAAKDSGAQMNVKLAAGALAPTTAPTFTTDKFGEGSPRWVLEFSNGNMIANNQNATAGDPNGWQYLLAAGGGWHAPSTDYKTALASANGNGAGITVRKAFIVADADQTYYAHPPVATLSDTLSAVQYNGQSPAAPLSIVITASAKCGTWRGSGWSIWYHPSAGAPARTVTVWNIVRGTRSKWDTSVRRTEGQFGRIHARNGAIAIGYWHDGKYQKQTYVLPSGLPACG